MSAAGAVRAIARAELRRRWRALVGLGLLAGFVGGFVVGAAVVARRTATAYDRLEVATKVEDVRVQVYGGRDLAERITALPSVRQSWIAGTAVAQVTPGEVTYLGLISGPPRPPDLLQPIVVDGRAARDDAADEVVMLESVARGVRPGDVLSLRFLTPQEFLQFDTGFGEPDGPAVDLRVTGLVRIPGGADSFSPLLATPAFAARYGDQVTVAHHVSLLRRAGSASDFEAQLNRLRDEAGPRPEGGEEFEAFDARFPAEAATEVDTTAGVLAGGLMVMAVGAGVAGLLALAQALARHQSAATGEHAVEAALGLTPGERVTAHVLPTLLVVAVAVTGAAVGGLLAGWIQPLGSLRRYEPNPGWAPNVGLVVAGGAIIGCLVLLLAAAAASRAGRRRPRVPLLRPNPMAERAAALGAEPALTIGVRFALERGRSPTQVPVWSSLGGAVVAVAGLVATATFASSLDRLVTTPSRYGWPFDFIVLDVTDQDLGRLVEDQRVAAVAEATTATVQLGGRPEIAQVLDAGAGKGTIRWSMAEGRLPALPDEIALGTRLARERGMATGDVVETVDTEGARHQLRVAGVGWWPQSGSERFANSAVLTRAGLARYGLSEPFRQALVKVGDADPDAVAAELAQEHELGRRELPTDVDNLRQLGRLPVLLGAFLVTLGAAAVGHAVVMAIRRRARDLAVLRAVGLTPRQAGGALAVMAATTAVVGVVVGMPTGLALGRLLWRVVAEGAAVAGDALVPVGLLVVVVPASVAFALAVAAWPAWRAARLRPATILHAE